MNDNFTNKGNIIINSIELQLTNREQLLFLTSEAIEKKNILNIIAYDFRHILFNYNYFDKNSKYLFYPDSSGIFLILRIFYRAETQYFRRLVSTNFHYELLRISDKMNYKLFLLGDTTKTLNSFIEKINEKFINIEIVGFVNGYGDIESPNLISKINNSNADILLVGLGVPKQEIWLIENSQKLNISVRITVGAFFTFFSEKIKRAPIIYQKLYLEWLYRFFHEPFRLFARYFIQFPKAIIFVAKEKWKK
ncbi:MAG: WecB/TagA/CpsF family glycosyltransferase [Ignavibacteriales bacterium]|nr:WecB/TagA/CpsF family glycosyltransferase [Ignavibacteriales bacterium]